jgi:PAS domain S-box-containing protein
MNVEPQAEDAAQPQARIDPQVLAMVNLIPAHTWVASASGALTFANHRCSDYLGLPEDHPVRLGIITGAAWDSHIPLLHPEDHEETRRVWSTCLGTSCAGQVSFRVRDAEGRYRWFLSRADPVRASDGTLLYWLGINLDIEDLKQAEFYISEGQRLANMGSWGFGPDGFDYWSPELFRIHGLDARGKAPTVNEYLEGLVHPDDRESLSQAIPKLYAAGAPFDFMKRIVRPDGGIRQLRCVGMPITHAGIVEGFVGTDMDVTEQAELTFELQRRDAYLAEAQRLSHTGSFGWKISSGEIFWSDETFRIFQCDPSTKPTLALILSRVHEDDRTMVQQKIDQALHGAESADFEHRLLLPDGSIKHVRVTAHLAGNSLACREYVGAITDVSEQRQAEAIIRERELDLQQILDFAPQHVTVLGPDGSPLYTNLVALKYFGVDLNQWRVEMLSYGLAHPDDRERLLPEVKQIFLDGVPHEFEARLRRHDGAFRWFLFRVNPRKDEQGRILRWYSTRVDIEDRKRAEEALRTSEAYLAEAQRLTQTGSWAWNPASDNTHYSAECYRLLGFSPDGGSPPSLESVIERIHPDDRERCRAQVAKGIQEKVDFELGYRIVHPDGKIRDIHCVSHPVLNRSGELVELVGTIIDITERKRAEERTQSQGEAIRLALNAFVEELDVNRFLGDLIAELNKQFHARSWELWLFDEAVGALLLHSSSNPGESLNSETDQKVARPLEELRGIWQTRNAVRVPRLFQLSPQTSLLSGRWIELLSARGIKTLMIVPLVLGEQNLGFVELHFDSPVHFTLEDLELAQTLANHATLAFQLSRLARRAEQMAVTEERNRLAREIHDTMAQAFAGIVLHSEALGTSMAVSKRRSRKALSQIQKLARSGLDEARRSVQALRPKALEGGTLSQALEQAANRLAASGRLSCHFRQRGETRSLQLEAQNELFRIAQEALTNISKHARANSVWISLTFTAQQISLTVRDDGIGFAATASPKPKRTYGLAGMRERAQRIGGQLQIKCPKAGGTSVHVRVPIGMNDQSLQS